MGWGGYGDAMVGSPTFRSPSGAGEAAKKMDALRKKGVDVQPVADRRPQDRQELLGRSLVRAPRIVSATSKTACRAAAPTSATARSATWPSPRAASRPKCRGSELYNVKIEIKTLPGKQWSADQGAVQRPNRLAAGVAPGPPLRPGHGRRDRSAGRAVPVAEGDFL